MPWGKLLFAGLLLAVAGFAIPDAGSTAEQVSEVRTLHDEGGVEATGTVVERAKYSALVRSAAVVRDG
jgi:hypothetical protein